MPSIPPLSFATRVRGLMNQRGLTSAVLAERAQMSPSVLSRLLTGTNATRRDPQIEQLLAIARGLEVAPAELVSGTDAEPILGQWIPRDEFEKEVHARAQAQAEASELRTDLAGLRSELKSLEGELQQMAQEVANASQRDVEARREQAVLRSAKDAAEARLGVATQERNQAWALAQQNYDAWVEAQTWILHLKRQVEASQGAAWLSGLVGAEVGLILANAASDPKKR